MKSFRALLLTIFVSAAVLAAACGGSKSCSQGTEQCPCYANATCNAGLSCFSNTCVNAGGAGGTSGAAGTAGTGATAGTSLAGTGGASAAGAGGATTGGSGGAGTGGGAGSCAANTSTDPKNCGACGHVCKNADPIFGGSCPTAGCCTNGACGPSPGACITKQSGFTTCDDYCASIGETCAQQGCVLGSVTWEGWVDTNRCETIFNPTQARGTVACATPIGFDGTAVSVRCCCTDTH